MIDLRIFRRLSSSRMPLAALALSFCLAGLDGSSVWADGGNGGSTFPDANGGTGGAGTGGNAGSAGTAGVNGGGGGGGGAAGGGAGGTGFATGAGGAGGTSGSPDGQAGASGSAGGNNGGGGGGGGFNGTESAIPLANTGLITGGNGGSGGNGAQSTGVSGGGGGGAGGYGAVVSSGGTSVNSGSITGGTGGKGGTGNLGFFIFGASGNGGDGGVGLQFTTPGATFMNIGATPGTAAVTGGNGGAGGDDFGIGPGSTGLGGQGIVGSDLTVLTNGLISGGLSGDGATRSNAITFTGGVNILEIQPGYQFTGNVVANSAADLLRLGGTGTATFNLDDLGPGQAFQNFGNLEKTGSGTWTLIGTKTYPGSTTVSAGILRGNADSLQGDILNNAAVVFDQTAGGTYSGIMSGTGSLTKSGAGTLILTGANNYGGGTTVSAGTLRAGTVGALPNFTNYVIDGGMLDLNSFNLTASSLSGQTGAINLGSASLTIDQAINTTFDGSILGTGSLAKNGTGVLVLTGANTYTGDTVVNNGYLAINGSVAGKVLVDFNGGLGGVGTIGGDLFYDGAVTPGATPVSIGTLNVLGNFTPGANSYLHINFDETHHSQVHAHSATLGGNGTVYFHSLNGQYVPGMQYTFLTTTTSISGQFNNVLDDLPLVDVLVGYTSNSAYFYIQPNGTSFSSVANTPNQHGVASYLDANSSGASGDFSTIINSLTSLNTPQLRSAFDQLSGEAHATSSQVGVQTTTLMLQQVAQRLRSMSSEEGTTTNYMATTTSGGSSASSSPIQLVGLNGSQSGSTVQNPVMICDACDSYCNWNGWSLGYGLGGQTDRDGNAAGFNYGMGGVLVGADRWFDDQTLAGVTGGYLGSSFTTAGPDARVRNSAGQVATYFLRTNCDFYLSGAGGFQFDSYTSQRDIVAGGLNRTAAANYDGWQGYTYGELGRNLTGECGLVQPFIALQYVHLRQNGFNETGAGVANLNVSGSDTDSLRSFVGTRVVGNFGRRLTPEFQASWVHEYDSASSVVNARFGAIGGAGFATQGVNAGRDWALLGTGLSYCLSENIQLTGNYYAQVNSHQTYHVGAGALQFLW